MIYSFGAMCKDNHISSNFKICGFMEYVFYQKERKELS